MPPFLSLSTNTAPPRSFPWPSKTRPLCGGSSTRKFSSAPSSEPGSIPLRCCVKLTIVWPQCQIERSARSDESKCFWMLGIALSKKVGVLRCREKGGRRKKRVRDGGETVYDYFCSSLVWSVCCSTFHRESWFYNSCFPFASWYAAGRGSLQWADSFYRFIFAGIFFWLLAATFFSELWRNSFAFYGTSYNAPSRITFSVWPIWISPAPGCRISEVIAPNRTCNADVFAEDCPLFQADRIWSGWSWGRSENQGRSVSIGWESLTFGWSRSAVRCSIFIAIFSIFSAWEQPSLRLFWLPISNESWQYRSCSKSYLQLNWKLGWSSGLYFFEMRRSEVRLVAVRWGRLPKCLFLAMW